jgi:hypothetical protein
MRNLSKWIGTLPVAGWAFGDVVWVAGAIEGNSRYSKTHEGKWYSVTPIHSHTADSPVPITDETLIRELEEFCSK